MVRTNLSGSVSLARHALPVLRAQGRGSLVLVGSVTGHVAVPSLAPYAASTWAARALARRLQLENRDRPGVRIRCVSPRVVRTPIWERAGNSSGRVVLDRVARPRRRTQVGPADLGVRARSSGRPAAYDALVGPVYRRFVEDRSRPLAPTPGTVPDPHRAEAGAGLEAGHAV